MFRCFCIGLIILNTAFCEKKVTIGLVFDGPRVEENIYVPEIKRQIEDLVEGEYTVDFINFEGDWTCKGSQEAYNKAIGCSDVDVVITMGFLASDYAVHQKIFKKPVVVSYDINLFYKDAKDRIFSNKLAYYRGKVSFFEQIPEFKELTGVKKIGVIGDASLMGEDIPSWSKKQIEQALGGDIRWIAVENEIEGVVEQLKGLDGVVFLPTWRLKEESFESLIKEINRKKLPSFSFLGEFEVEKGVLMSMTPKSEIMRLARRLALNTQQYLISKNSKEMVIEFVRANELIINEQTADRIGMDFSWKVLSEAIIVDKRVIPKRCEMDIKQTVDRAIACNLNLNAQRYVVKSGRQEVLRQLSFLLPNAKSDLVARIIDTNSARYGMGQEPEKLVRGKIELTQMIYDDDTVAKYTIEKYLQEGRKYNKDRVELNVILSSAVSYLSILKVEAEKRVALENIALTKANLKRAHELVTSGQARLSEVYRWESELASNRESLAEVQARLENRKADLNQVLNRTIISKVYLEDIHPFEGEVSKRITKVMSLMSTPNKFEKFKKLMICVAREKQPQIKEFEQQILAQKRRLTNTKRSFILPKFNAFVDLESNMYKGGQGDQPPPGLSNSKLSSAVGIKMEYPLFTSGRRFANRNKAQFELDTLCIQKKDVVQEIDLRVVKAIDNMKSSYDQIFFAKKAKEAAEKNLVIVTNSYSRGVVSIVDLIDAQNTTIVSSLSYFNAIYDYLIDYVILQRAVGEFDVALSGKEQSVYTEAIGTFIGKENE